MSSSQLETRSATIIDFLVPLIIFVFCGMVAYLTTTFSKAPDIVVGHAMQARDFPLFIAAVIAFFNLVLVWQIWLDPPMPRPLEPYQTWFTMLLLGVFFLLTNYADMFLAFAVVMFAMCIVWGERRLWVCALVAILTPGIIFFFFDLVLQVRFPRGILTNLYYG